MTIDFNTIIGTTGTILGLFGIIISIYSYIKSRKTKKLAVNQESTILISETLSKYENLKISYNNDDINSLTSTIVKIKNIGTDIVEPSDLIPSSPIKIHTTDKFLFNDTTQYEIVTSNSKNNVSLQKLSNSTLQLTFEFLNPKDEIFISLLHTGEITVSGDLKTNAIKNYSKKKYDHSDTSHYNNYEEEISYNANSLFKLMLSVLTLMMMFIILILAIAGRLSIENMSMFTLIMLIAFMTLLQNIKH